MEEKSYTVKDVIELTIEDLRSINVPVDMLDQMGPPLSRALGNLRNILKSFEEQETKERIKHEPEDISAELTEAEEN